MSINTIMTYEPSRKIDCTAASDEHGKCTAKWKKSLHLYRIQERVKLQQTWQLMPVISFRKLRWEDHFKFILGHKICSTLASAQSETCPNRGGRKEGGRKEGWERAKGGKGVGEKEKKRRDKKELIYSCDT